MFVLKMNAKIFQFYYFMLMILKIMKEVLLQLMMFLHFRKKNDL